MTEEILVEAGRTEGRYWRDLWAYRELLYFLAWRDVVVRYKQTTIGVAWAVLRPLLTMGIFVVVFGMVAQLPSGGQPYAILVCGGLLPWQLFASALTESSSSLVGSTNLISKVYFPRLLVPVSAIAPSLVDFLVSLSILVLLMFWYGCVPTWRILALPVFLGLTLALAAGAGVGLAALNVRFRDIRYITPFVVQLGLYISPVGFDSSVVPQPYRLFWSLNPMVGIIDGFRWCIGDGQRDLEPSSVLLAVGGVALSLLAGIVYFRRTERTMVDIL